jgi:hypothetical protein
MRGSGWKNELTLAKRVLPGCSDLKESFAYMSLGRVISLGLGAVAGTRRSPTSVWFAADLLLPESNVSKSGRDRVIERARRDNLTVRQLAQIAGSYGGLALGRHPGDDRRPDGGVALERSLRRLQHYVPVGPGRPRRVRRPGRPRIAAPPPLPPRIRGPNLAREFGIAPPREPFFAKRGF